MDYDRLRELQAKFDENPRRYFAPLANEYRKGGNPKRAIEICRAHLAQMPGHMSGQVVYGQSLFEGGEYEEARKVFEGALVLDPENLIALRSLGDLALQAGDNPKARAWYSRLLEADPKDAAVIALIAVIDSSAPSSTAPPATSEFTVDFSFVDNPPAESSGAAAASGSGATSATEKVEPGAASELDSDAGRGMTVSAAESDSTSTPDSFSPDATQSATAPDTTETAAATAAAGSTESTQDRVDAQESPPLGLERHYPTADSPPRRPEPIGPDRDALDWSPTGSAGASDDRADTAAYASEEEPAASNQAETTAAQGRESSAPGQKSSAPAAPTSHAEEFTTAPVDAQTSSFVGTNPEPFVNETMAQLYLQQGYRQLALRVYRQLSERQPNEQKFKDRIAEIEATQASEPETIQARRSDPPSIESPTPQPAAPRAPSTESPLPHGPGTQPSSIESPGGDSFPIDSPPTSPSSEPDSIESPAREEPRAEPEGIAARQPSMREFFATLGRRRPPPMKTSPADSWGRREAAPHAAPQENLKPTSLDAVFAGAKVSSTDARAASTLAGAFSATARATSPPSPPAHPTPRANPRLQTQESEEDVAKFRAWLDGLTGE